MSIGAVKGLPAHAGVRENFAGLFWSDRDQIIGRLTGIVSVARLAEDE